MKNNCGKIRDAQIQGQFVPSLVNMIQPITCLLLSRHVLVQNLRICTMYSDTCTVIKSCTHPKTLEFLITVHVPEYMVQILPVLGLCGEYIVQILHHAPTPKL